MKFEKVSSVYILTEPHMVVLEEKFPSRTGKWGELSSEHSDGKSRLYLNKGMSWDGSSGAIDTVMGMEASLVHDWLCNANNTSWGATNASWGIYRKKGDKEYYRLLRKNGRRLI